MDNIFVPNQRIVMLQGLERDPGRSLSNEMLQRLLRDYGHNCSISEVNTQIAWLEKQGHVKAKQLKHSGLIMAKLLRSGIDIALGHARVEGIDPPLED